MSAPVISLTQPVRIGLQGGRGSFNELAADQWLRQLPDYDQYQSNIIKKYLYTTRGVLEALRRGEIDYGQFAVSNSLVGPVEETMAVIDQFSFKEVGRVEYPIEISLYVAATQSLHKITTVMSHPHVLKECRETLHQNWPHWQLQTGVNELLDSTAAAEALATSQLPLTTAVLGPANLDTLLNLQLVSTNLQDAVSYTTFWVVRE